jgi:hypothetical protein
MHMNFSNLKHGQKYYHTTLSYQIYANFLTLCNNLEYVVDIGMSSLLTKAIVNIKM